MEWRSSIAGKVVAVELPGFVVSSPALPVHLIAHSRQVGLGGSFKSGAAAQMNSVGVSTLILHIDDIARDGGDPAAEDFQVCHFFTLEVSLHDVHVVSIACAEGDAVDLNPLRREDGGVLELDDVSTEPSTDVGVRGAAEDFLQVADEGIAWGNSCVVIIIGIIHLVAGVVVLVDDGLEFLKGSF